MTFRRARRCDTVISELAEIAVERDERNVESHFAFGENWSRYAEVVEDAHLEAAIADLARLVGRYDLAGLRFLDVGCGSGLHSVAAARLGALVTALDIDTASVRTTTALAERFGVSCQVRARVASVFELDPSDGFYDVVYSWGVLHHTGDMWEAVRKATGLVSAEPPGELVLALYRKTGLCPFWKVEKFLYSKAPKPLQVLVRWTYTVLLDLARLAKGTLPWRYRAEYLRQRGMQVKYDMHDWLGGYPYESASPTEVRSFLGGLGLVERAAFIRCGSPLVPGCDEYRFARINSSAGQPNPA